MIDALTRKPISILVSAAALAALGSAAWWRLPTELVPPASFPRLSVTTSWPGASPEAVEAYITAPLDGVIRQVDGVSTVSSVSEEDAGAGVSTLQVEFSPGTEVDFARLEISERIAALQDVLPAGASSPRVNPYIPPELADREQPSMRLSVVGSPTEEALSMLAETAIAPQIRAVRGVGSVTSARSANRIVTLEIDEAKALSFGVSSEDIRASVERTGRGADLGTLRHGGLRHTITIKASAGAAEELLNLPIATTDRGAIRLGDVAHVGSMREHGSGTYRIDGRPSVELIVSRAGGTNASRVAHAVARRVDALNRTLPSGIQVRLEAAENSALTAVTERFVRSLLLSGAAILLVVSLAFRSFRVGAALLLALSVASLSVPAGASAVGLSLNRYTLAGYAIAVGALVNIAVTVLYAVVQTRLRLAGKHTRIRATAMSATCSALSAAIVFIPFTLVRDELQVIYRPLVVVAGITLVAGVAIVLVLLPVLAPHLPFERVSVAFARSRYVRASTVIARALARPWWVIGVALIALVATNVMLLKHATASLSAPPRVDQPFVDVVIKSPRGSYPSRVDQVLREIEGRITGRAGVHTFVTRSSPGEGLIRIHFTDSARETGSAAQIKDEISSFVRKFGGMTIRVFGLTPSFYGGTGSPPVYAIRIRGYDYITLRRLAEEMGQRLRSFQRVGAIDINSVGTWLEPDRPSEFVFTPDRERLAMAGVSVRGLVSQIEALVGSSERRILLRLDDVETSLAIRLSSDSHFDVDDFLRTAVPLPSGSSVSLGSLGHLAEAGSQSRISREHQRYTRTVVYEFRGPDRAGDRLHDALIRSTLLPPGYSADGGESGIWTPRIRRQIYGSLVLAVGLLFMLSALAFESLKQPLCVMLSLPTGSAGAALAFIITGVPFTREAAIGTVVMAGIAAGSSILLVARFNSLRRERGITLSSAVLRGTIESTAPVLAAALASAAAMIPFVDFAAPAGDLVSAALLASIGGVIASSLLVLLLVPPLYLALESDSAK